MTKKLFTFFMLFVMGLLLNATEARADLMITPMRVVFGTRDRSATVELLNITDTTNTYRFSWSYLEAVPEGGYKQGTPPKANDPFAVSNMMIYSPRQVVIEPHGHQLIRLSLRRPANLPPGEYRAHLTMTQLAKPESITPDPNAKTVSMALKVNLSFSIPIIVRQGEDKDLKVSLSNPDLKTRNGGSVLNININRVAGKFSSYGTINVFWKSAKGDEKQIGTMNNVALYPEVQTRPVTIPLLTKDRIVGGTIRVEYDGKYESEGTKWAEKTFSVGEK